MNETANGNGGKVDWLRWTNTALMLLVAGLLGLYVKSNDERISRLEELVIKQERVVKVEEEVKRIALIQASRSADLDFLKGEVLRLREYHEK